MWTRKQTALNVCTRVPVKDDTQLSFVTIMDKTPSVEVVYCR